MAFSESRVPWIPEHARCSTRLGRQSPRLRSLDPYRGSSFSTSQDSLPQFTLSVRHWMQNSSRRTGKDFALFLRLAPRLLSLLRNHLPVERGIHQMHHRGQTFTTHSVRLNSCVRQAVLL